jgi:hypothetical protein
VGAGSDGLLKGKYNGIRALFLRKSLALWIPLGVGLAGLLILGSFFFLSRERCYTVNQVWRMLEDANMEGKRYTVRGDAIFIPGSDFKFNTLYLIDPETDSAYRQPEYGFWFGVRIADLSCRADEDAWTCEPFDPSHAQAFELKGTLHTTQVGKKEILWLSGIDLAHSRQLINGEWRPIPEGKFTIPLREDH